MASLPPNPAAPHPADDKPTTRRRFLAQSSQTLGAAWLLTQLPTARGSTHDASLTALSATAAVTAMRKGELQAEHYAQALLNQAAACTSLNAFRTLDPEQVLSAARTADQARAAGKPLGRLHGLPIPVKDSVNTRALPTSNGTLALKHFQPTRDAAVLQSLFAHGAILMGKTNLHELSFGWTSNNGHFGAVRNPYDPSRIPGGSSGGSGAAVAAHMAPLAIAADTLGSVRVPAACCGIAGFRPSFGRYPDKGVMTLTLNHFDQVGPVARSVADLALFDAVVTGNTVLPTATPLKGIRLGVSTDYLSSELAPEVARVTDEALRKLQNAGAVLVEVNMAETLQAAFEIAFTIGGYETVAGITHYLKQQGSQLTFEQIFAEVHPNVKQIMQAVAVPPNRPSLSIYETMLQRRTWLKRTLRRQFTEAGIAALVFPTLRMPPPKIGEDVTIDIAGQAVPLLPAMSRNVVTGSCASMASLVLPAGLTTDGLPIGIEFDALTGKDRELLSLGLSLEQALGPLPPPNLQATLSAHPS